METPWNIPLGQPTHRINVDAVARELQSKIAKWVERMSEIHLPEIYPRVIWAMEGGWYAEARVLLDRAEAFVVERYDKPYWRGFEVKGRIVAEYDFSPVAPITAEIGGVRGIFTMEADSSFQCVMQEPSQDGHVDEMIHEINRDERKRRQRKMGQLFVKYGVTKPQG